MHTGWHIEAAGDGLNGITGRKSCPIAPIRSADRTGTSFAGHKVGTYAQGGHTGERELGRTEFARHKVGQTLRSGRGGGGGNVK